MNNLLFNLTFNKTVVRNEITVLPYPYKYCENVRLDVIRSYCLSVCLADLKSLQKHSILFRILKITVDMTLLKNVSRIKVKTSNNYFGFLKVMLFVCFYRNQRYLPFQIELVMLSVIKYPMDILSKQKRNYNICLLFNYNTIFYVNLVLTGILCRLKRFNVIFDISKGKTITRIQ